MKDTIQFINTGFNRGINQPLDWWWYRLLVFKYYTLQSIKAQTNQNFYLLMNLRQNYPLAAELQELLELSGLKFVITYDDKPGDLQRVLGQLDELKEAKYVALTRIDSDDLFHKDLVLETKHHDFADRRALILQKGYCYDAQNRKLQHYKVMSPPNSTIMFEKEIFLDDDKKKEYLNIQGHDQVFSKFNSTVLSENKYMILIHGKNRRSQYFENAEELERFEIDQVEHDSILRDFGIWEGTYNTLWNEYEKITSTL